MRVKAYNGFELTPRPDSCVVAGAVNNFAAPAQQYDPAITYEECT